MATKEVATASLEVGPVKMTRKVSFRDEAEKKPIAEVILVEKYNQNVSSDTSGPSCLKCQII